jgi:Protein of unknown function, DUF624.
MIQNVIYQHYNHIELNFCIFIFILYCILVTCLDCAVTAMFTLLLNFQKGTEPIVLEYFEHGDTAEAALALDELNCGTKRYLVSRSDWNLGVGSITSRTD